jgi:acetyl esterase/lipase
MNVRGIFQANRLECTMHPAFAPAVRRVLAGALLAVASGLVSHRASAQENAPERDGALFRKLDANRDGKLSPQELPPKARARFAETDLDGNGSIDLREHQAALRRLSEQGRLPEQGGRAIPQGTRVLKDLAYVTDGHSRQKLDLYLPPGGASPKPLVLWVHGGGWQSGSKENSPALRLLSKDFAVASLNYRLSQDAVFPAQIEDCKAAVRYLRQHAAEYRLDPDHIGAWGSSAGGNLVALLATSAAVKELESVPPGGAPATYSTQVQAAVDWFGPIDLVMLAKQGVDDGPPGETAAARFLGGPVLKNLDLARRASPLTYLSNDDPPVLVMHGDRDRRVPVEQSRIFDAALRKAGVKSTLIVIPGAGHGATDKGFADLTPVAEFFTTHLKPQ